MTLTNIRVTPPGNFAEERNYMTKIYLPVYLNPVFLQEINLRASDLYSNSFSPGVIVI